MKIEKRSALLPICVVSFVLLYTQVNWRYVLGEKLIVASHTTLLTEPIRGDGRVDYIAAINRELASNGVTPETNVLVDLLQVIPFEIQEAEYQAEFANHLGLSEFPKEDRYVESFDKFYRQHYSGRTDNNIWRAEFERVRLSPWESKQFPHWKAWLDEYDESIDFLVTATKKPHYYHPLIVTGDPDEQMLMFTLLPVTAGLRRGARILCCRAMNSLGDREIDAALEDIEALYRLAQHCGQSLMVIEGLVQASITRTAYQATQVLLSKEELSEEQLQRFSEALSELPETSGLATRVDCGERWMALDLIQQIDFYQLSISDLFLYGGWEMRPSHWPAEMLIDWNIAMVETNQRYDKHVEILREKSGKQRLRSLAKFEAELNDEMFQKRNLVKLLLGGPHGRGRWMSQYLNTAVLSRTLRAAQAEVAHRIRMDLLQTSIVMERFRRETGSYPQQLAELVPKWSTDLPLDRFTDADLKYKRTTDGYVIYSVGRDLQDNGAAEDSDDVKFQVDKLKFSME